MPDDMTTSTTEEYLTLTADIVAAHVSNNRVSPAELPGLIAAVHAALAGLNDAAAEPAPEKQEPAVSIRASIKPDYLVCLEDGAKLKMLKRYLRTNFNMSPEDYRRKWGLPSDYPMVAPSYAEKRRGLAQAIGLGRKAREEAEAVLPEDASAEDASAEDAEASPLDAAPELTAEAPVTTPKRRGRPPKSGVATPPPADPQLPDPPVAGDGQQAEPAPADKPARKPRARKLSGKEALAKARGGDQDA